jgi:hypothetical protein
MLAKNDSGYLMGYFFTDSSGPPVSAAHVGIYGARSQV